MKSIPLEKPDVRFGAPANWNHETDGICHTLDVWRRDGAWVSGWTPSPADLAKLNAGEPLFLHIFLDVHPVIAWDVGYEKPAEAATRHCAVCGCVQFDTPSGICCENGHGGADSK